MQEPIGMTLFRGELEQAHSFIYILNDSSTLWVFEVS